MTVKLGFLTRSALFSEDFILRVEAPGHRNEYDEFISGETTDYVLKGNVEPLTGIDRYSERSGQKAYETLKISTNRKHIVTVLKQGEFPRKGDIVVYKDKAYRIDDLMDWAAHDVFDFICILIDKGNQR